MGVENLRPLVRADAESFSVGGRAVIAINVRGGRRRSVQFLYLSEDRIEVGRGPRVIWMIPVGSGGE